MYYPVSSLVTLFANILQNPQDPNARSDLDHMQLVLEFLRSVLALDEIDEGATKFEDGSVNRMMVVCGEFQRIAKLVLDKSENGTLSKKKRKPEGQPTNLRPERRIQTTEVITSTMQPTSTAPQQGHICGMEGIDMNAPPVSSLVHNFWNYN